MLLLLLWLLLLLPAMLRHLLGLSTTARIPCQLQPMNALVPQVERRVPPRRKVFRAVVLVSLRRGGLSVRRYRQGAADSDSRQNVGGWNGGIPSSKRAAPRRPRRSGSGRGRASPAPRGPLPSATR